MQLFISQDTCKVNWVVWITCRLWWHFLSAVWALSLTKHTFTAEDPSKQCNTTFSQICSHEETKKSINLHLGWPEGENYFWVNCSFNWDKPITHLKFETACKTGESTVNLWRMTFGWKAADMIVWGLIDDVLMTVSDCWVTRTGDRGVEVTVTEGTAVEEGVVLHRGVALPAKQQSRGWIVLHFNRWINMLFS